MLEDTVVIDNFLIEQSANSQSGACKIVMNNEPSAVADLGIFRGGFRFKKFSITMVPD